MRTRGQQQSTNVYQCYSWETQTTTIRTMYSFGHAAFLLRYARQSPWQIGGLFRCKYSMGRCCWRKSAALLRIQKVRVRSEETCCNTFLISFHPTIQHHGTRHLKDLHLPHQVMQGNRADTDTVVQVYLTLPVFASTILFWHDIYIAIHIQASSNVFHTFTLWHVWIVDGLAVRNNTGLFARTNMVFDTSQWLTHSVSSLHTINFSMIACS